MAKERRKFLVPLWGYVVLNLVFLATMAGFYTLSVGYLASRQPPVPSTGIFPVLATCYLAFTFVCVYDAIFERAARKQKARKPDMEEAAVLASQERVRKVE